MHLASLILNPFFHKRNTSQAGNSHRVCAEFDAFGYFVPELLFAHPEAVGFSRPKIATATKNQNGLNWLFA